MPIRTLRSWSGCGTLWWARSAARRRSTPSRSSWPPRRHHRPEPQYEGARIRCSGASSGPCCSPWPRRSCTRPGTCAGRSPGQRGGVGGGPLAGVALPVAAGADHLGLRERGPALRGRIDRAPRRLPGNAGPGLPQRRGERRLSGLARGGAGPGARGRGGRPRPGHLSRAGGGCARGLRRGRRRLGRIGSLPAARPLLPGWPSPSRSPPTRSPTRRGVENSRAPPTWL